LKLAVAADDNIGITRLVESQEGLKLF